MYYCPLKAAQEVNLSMVWCILVVGFAYKLLMSLTGLYFEGVEAQGERSLVIVMAAAYLFLAMMILIGNIFIIRHLLKHRVYFQISLFDRLMIFILI